MASDQSFSETLRARRKERGLKLRQAARLIGISDTYLSHLEWGKREAPEPPIIKKIAEIYRLSFAELLYKAGMLVPKPGTRESRLRKKFDDLIDSDPEVQPILREWIDALKEAIQSIKLATEDIRAISAENKWLYIGSRTYRLEEFKKDAALQSIPINDLPSDIQDHLLSINDLRLMELRMHREATEDFERKLGELEQQLAAQKAPTKNKKSDESSS
jgi:transcriptional regulator with XRE-family HTH domain